VGKILDDYIRVDLAEHLALDAEAGFEHFARQLTESLQRIRRRLGEERYQLADGCMQAAIAAHRSDDDAEGHRDWIELLLRDYYDPMYDYQLAKSTERVVFRGGPDALREWALSVALSGPA
jgi:tRNA 2-selenouridine synthase